MTNRVTQCPHCRTAFRVTEAQLQVARGSVRCGSCLEVFEAARHWVGGAAEPAAAPAPTSEAPPPAAPAADEDDLRFDDDTPLDFDEAEAPARSPDADVVPASETRPGADDNSLTSADDARENRTEPPVSEPAAATEAPATEYVDGRGTAPDRDLSETEPDASVPPAPASNESHAADVADDVAGAGVADANTDTVTTPERQAPVPAPREPAPEERYGSDDDRDEETFLDLDDWEEEPGSIFQDLDELTDEAADSDEDWARELLEEVEAPEAESTPESGLAPGCALQPESAEPREPDAPGREWLQSETDEAVDALWQTGDLAPGPAAETADGGGEAAPRQSAASVDPAAPTTRHHEGHDELDGLLDEVERYEQRAASEGWSDDGDEDRDEAAFAPFDTGERAGGWEGDQSPGAFAAEPLEFRAHAGRDRRPLLRLAGCVLALLVLAAQMLAFNFDTLARGDARPWLASMCSLAGCELPQRSELAAIRSHNLLVRSHPDVPGALVVDAIVTNTAAFAQDFPRLELRFSDLTGRTVASRRFAPNEYLGGELAGARQMPPRQPVHVSLALRDPGPEAVNYEINFAAAPEAGGDS